MPEAAADPTGQICWFEVPVTSVSRASAFYASVLGWTCNDLKGTPSPSGREKSIHMFNKGNLNGAFLLLHDGDSVQATEPGKNLPITSFAVANIAEAIKKIEDAGGKIHVPRTEIGGGMGFFARFVDTEGNLQGIWAQE